MIKRIQSLDVMRGLTIMGMILFNTYSGFHFAPLNHAPWIGLTMADMAFPFFTFIMGITTFLSLQKYGFEPSGQTILRIVRRTLGIVLVCWVFDWLGSFIFSFYYNDALPFWERLLHAANKLGSLRLSGVLVRLGICYGATALFSLWLKHKRFPLAIALILVGYFVMLLFGHGFERTEENILGIVDRALLGVNHMCNDGGIDPEGVLSTIPAIAHTMLGFWVGSKIFNKANQTSVVEKTNFLLLLGAGLTCAGLLLYGICPISKKIWSPTFVMITCGLGSQLLALLMRMESAALSRMGETIRRGFFSFFRIFGANPLFLYLLSEGILWPLELIKLNVDGEQMDVWGVIFSKALVPLFGTYGGDLAFGFLNVFFCWAVGYILYRAKIFIRL